MQRLQLSTLRQNKFGESYFPEVNHLTFEKLASDEIFKNYYSELFEKEEFLYVVIGTDSGLLYNYIQNHPRSKKLKFVFIDFAEVNQSLGLLNDEQPEVWEGDVRLVNDDFQFGRIGPAFNNYVVRRKIVLIKSLAVMDAKPNSPYSDLWEKFEVRFNTFRRSEFNAQSTKVFEEERLFNAADNLVPTSVLSGSLNGKDVVVLGGGPTLDDSIDWLRENQDKLVIFAAARIAKRLAKEQITPDFFVTVDPFDWSFDNSKSVLAFSEESILVHSFHAQHKLVSQWNGLSVYAGNQFGFELPDVKPNIDTPGPTVTNAAVHVAVSLGAKRVFFSGIDFCFARGLTHESGSDEAKMSDAYGHRSKAKLEDNAGNMTETGEDFFSAMHSMQSAIYLYLSSRPNMQFFSLGLHSAKIKNVNYVPCEEVVLTETDKTELTLNLRSLVGLTIEEKLERANRALTELKAQLKRFVKLQSLASDGVAVSGKLYEPKTQEPRPKQMEKVKKLRKKVENLVGKDGDMLMNYQAAYFYDSFIEVDQTQKMEKEEIVEQLTAFFSGVEKVSRHFVRALEKGIERAQLRVDELGGVVEPSKLAIGWEAWHEYGRAMQWAQWHDKSALAEDELKSLEDSLARFKEEYERQDHNYISRVKKRISDVAILLERATIAFNANNVEELAGIIEHTQNLETGNESHKESFVNLLNGMLSQLNGDPHQAVEYYKKVQMPILRHQALKKALNVYMDMSDYDGSLITLEQLCQYSLDYMVPYADLLALLDQKQFSAQVLMMYTSSEGHQENVAALIKLAQLQMDLALLDDALAVLNRVLTIDSTNKSALHLKSQLLPS